MTDRGLDLRDSVVTSKLHAQRKAPGLPHPASLSVDKVTPWGSVLVSDADVPPSPGRVVTPAHNHFQNDQTLAGKTSGVYRVPDVSATHNHFQNLETGAPDAPLRVERLKMVSSKINDGMHGDTDFAAGMATGAASPSRLKMAAGTSRINDGHDIFGAPVTSARRPPPATEAFVDRPQRGPIRAPKDGGIGYTDAQKKF